VVPSWHEAPSDPNAICLAVDPGLAFGTGSHPTTHLCLLWLEEQSELKNQSLLDYGCGSGILAIAAAKLGCKPVIGTDIDPQAMLAARSNAEINHTEIRFVLPNDDAPELAAKTKYDIVMANILANPLQVLAPALVNKMRSGGQIVLSGVLARQAEVLLLDEPTAGLDLNGRKLVADLVAAERARGVTVVMATHELTDAEHATSVMLLAQRVVSVGPPDVALRDEYLRECFGFTQPH
jgi:ribosomal protein L11 methylase PrmA